MRRLIAVDGACPQLGSVDPPGRMVLPRPEQRLGAEEAADVVGAEGRGATT